MLKAYEFRIFPTKEQEQFLLKTNGLCRLYWNTTLAKKQETLFQLLQTKAKSCTFARESFQSKKRLVTQTFKTNMQ